MFLLGLLARYLTLDARLAGGDHGPQVLDALTQPHGVVRLCRVVQGDAVISAGEPDTASVEERHGQDRLARERLAPAAGPAGRITYPSRPARTAWR